MKIIFLHVTNLLIVNEILINKRKNISTFYNRKTKTNKVEISPPVNIFITIYPTIQAYRPHPLPPPLTSTSNFFSFGPLRLDFPIQLSPEISGQLRQYWRCRVGSLVCICICVVYTYIIHRLGNPHRDTYIGTQSFVSRNSGLISYTQGRQILPFFLFSFFTSILKANLLRLN